MSLVRSVLEFACPVWNPFYDSHRKRIESIQKQFLLFALRRLNWENRLVLPPYRHRLLLLDINTLEHRRQMLSVSFVWNIINSNIDSPFLLNKINFNCPPRRSRFYVPIRLNESTVNYLNNESYNQCLSYYNKFHNVFLSCNKANSVKKCISEYQIIVKEIKLKFIYIYCIYIHIFYLLINCDIVICS